MKAHTVFFCLNFGLCAFANLISWPKSGNSMALTSVSENSARSSGLTVLYYDYEPSGAQFPYTKLTQDPGRMPLVNVHLINAALNIDVIVQSQFDAISQQCSCYWLNAKAFAPLYKVPSSKYYQIAFRTPMKDTGGYDMEILSGYFGFSWARNPGGIIREGEILDLESSAEDPISFDIETNSDKDYDSDGVAETDTASSGSDASKPKFLGFLFLAIVAQYI